VGLGTVKKVVKVRKADPPSAVDGLKGIDKRVGSWGKKRKNKKRRGASTGGFTSAAQ
jgi:hypothetical protein